MTNLLGKLLGLAIVDMSYAAGVALWVLAKMGLIRK